jgi:hypothetical protein
MYLLKKYPDANWDICELLRNPNIDIKYIRDFYTKRYSYKNWKKFIKFTSYNINIDIEFIKKNIYHLDWSGISLNNKFNTDVHFIKTYARFLNWSVISSCDNMPLNVIEQTNDLPWNWGKYGISSNLNLKVWFIKKFINKPFDWNAISKNPCITIGFLKTKQIRTNLNWRKLSSYFALTIKILKQFPNEDWHWDLISSNNALTIEMLETFPDKNWDWRRISSNKALTIEMLEKFPDKNWDWRCGISSNKALTIEMLEKFPNKDWRFGQLGISHNQALTIEMLVKFPDKDWHFDYGGGISFNSAFTIEMLEKFPDKDWYFGLGGGLSSNKLFTLEMYEKFPDKNWEWVDISRNKNLTLKFIEKHINKIYFSELSRNNFNYCEKKKIISKKIKLFHYLSFSKLPYDIKRCTITF